MRITKARIGGLTAVTLLAAGCGSTAAVSGSHHVAAVAPLPSTSASAPAKPAAKPATPAPSAARTTPAPTSATGPATPPAFSYTNSVSVVSQFYQDLSDSNYAAAWALGGSNLAGGASYAAWAAGYGTTASFSLGEFSQFGSSQVQVDLSALQSDGTARTYTGTYTVTGGVITAASITETGAQAAPAQPQPGSADTSCGAGVYAGPSTSCAFAQAVAAAWDGQPTDTENVTSPVTGLTYTMTYGRYGNLVQVTGGNNATVLFTA